ncbi:leucine-rich repeat-containing protein 15-like [Penaeus japonicus]|uniref:leucine-rich repeat-containing protein 15-like n=1 Tax=Penaeus japonicus TaxID=27405 RepID=UPI001C70FE28|nr:leucine-rich repeat-containing protein 15-like [Penaeus japonicus]
MMWSTMEKSLCLMVLWLAVMLPSALSQCPPSANIEPCSCSVNGFVGLQLTCFGIVTEEELRSIFHNTSFPVTSFDEINIINCATESLGADLFGQLDADRLYIENNPNLKSVDLELLASPMSDRVRVIGISKNPQMEVADLRLFENVKRTDLMVTMIENNFKTITPPSKPINIYSLNLGRNAIASVTADMLKNLQGVEYLYLYENGLTTINSGALTTLDSLKDLQLHMNSLGPVLSPGAVALPASLTSLTLDSNGISEVMPEAITGFSSSAYLSLRSNSLQSFPEEAFRPLLERLAEGGGRLDLSGNFGLPCDCSIVWLFLTPGVLDAVDQYYCENYVPITAIDSEALIQSCSLEGH